MRQGAYRTIQEKMVVFLNSPVPVPVLPILQKSVGSAASRFFQTSDTRIRPSAFQIHPNFPGS